MKPHIKIDITAGTIASMTIPQFEALRDNICREGRWDSIGEETPPVRMINVSGGSYLGVHLPDMFIGIEKDGYTHS